MEAQSWAEFLRQEGYVVSLTGLASDKAVPSTNHTIVSFVPDDDNKAEEVAAQATMNTDARATVSLMRAGQSIDPSYRQWSLDFYYKIQIHNPRKMRKRK